MSLYEQQDKNIAKTWGLMASFLVIIIALGYVFSVTYNSPGVLYFAVIFSIVMNIGSYWFSDKIVLKISGAREANRDEFIMFHRVVENLCITIGLKEPKLYIIGDSAPNAFATGRNEEHAAVAVTTGLLEVLDQSELEGVIAHELSHIKNKDILISTIAVVLVGFITLLADMFRRMSFFGAKRSDDRDGGGQITAILWIVGIVLSILSPLIATLIQLAVSRKREFLADASGALITRYPEGLANALKKISAYEQPMKKVNNATAHLFIASPFGANTKTKFIANLFMTHPPVEERISALLGKS